MPALAAARDYGIPRKILTNRLHGKVADFGRFGRPIKLSEKEKDLCIYTDYMAGRGFPLTINQIIMYASSIGKAQGGKCTFQHKDPIYIVTNGGFLLGQGTLIILGFENLHALTGGGLLFPL